MLVFMRDDGRNSAHVRFGPRETSISAYTDPDDDDRRACHWAYKGYNPLLDVAFAKDSSDRRIYAVVDETFYSEFGLRGAPLLGDSATRLPVAFINAIAPDLYSPT
jgi:hypothetical protein